MDASRLVRPGLLAAAVFLGACGGGITPIQTAYNKGVYLASAGEYAAAIAEYREALLDDPSDLRSMFNLAATLEMEAARLRRLDRLGGASPAGEPLDLVSEARGLYEEILRRVPGHERATQNLAALEWEAGEAEASTERLQRLARERSDLPGPRIALAARALDEDDRAGARRFLEEALGASPTHPDALALLGDLEAREDRFEAAVEAYRKVLVRRPEDIHALTSLGEACLKAGDFAGAEGWLRQALFVFPRNARAHRLMAGLSERNLQWEDAVRHWWEVRSLILAGSEDGSLDEVEDKLDELYRTLLSR